MSVCTHQPIKDKPAVIVGGLKAGTGRGECTNGGRDTERDGALSVMFFHWYLNPPAEAAAGAGAGVPPKLNPPAAGAGAGAPKRLMLPLQREKKQTKYVVFSAGGHRWNQ